ncbi:MAG: alanine racemase [Alphaproteobacteria bacterium]|nr:alanine racemase [Alphaproteobacteria bacterium]
MVQTGFRSLLAKVHAIPFQTSLCSTSGVIEIDLAAIADNFRRMSGWAHGAEVAAAVKADAYGLGGGRVAPVLREAGCRSFFVATPGEGIALRSVLDDAAIYVLNGLMAGDEAAFEEYELVPVLNDPGQVDRWAAYCARRGAALSAALHVDTGMNRLGMTGEEAAAMDSRGPGFPVALLMSHLACARHPDDAKNADQLARFRQLDPLFPAVARSLANSGGVMLGADYAFDMARVGIALYGGAPLDGGPNPMDPVVRVRARVLQIRQVPRGETVGYDATFTAPRDMRVAVVAAGYGDGWPTVFTGKGAALAGGARVPFVGRVSMDLNALDVTGLPEGQPAVGDLVDLIGPGLGVDEAAGRAGLIAYELLTALSRRFERRYLPA